VPEESDRRSRAISSELDRVHGEGGPLEEVAPKILRELCEGLGWDVGIMWTADESGTVLHFAASWHDPSLEATELERMSARSTFSPGVGLPGRILSGREPSWIRDVQNDIGFPRAPAAMEDDLRSAFGFPLIQGRKVVGVIELFSRQTRERDRELLAEMAPIGMQVGRMLEGDGAD
jgi:signal transduction protein with GAF and PtsI domain